MPKQTKELSALTVKSLVKEGFYAVGGAAGLYLQVRSPSSRSWILKVVIQGKRHEIGLGSYTSLTLSEAREKAQLLRKQIAQGLNPLHDKRLEKYRRISDAANTKTFKECAFKYIEQQKPSWKNAKHATQWESTLTTYAYPTIGDIRVKDIELAHIISILEPIWTTKTETASRLRGRIEAVLDWAIVREYRPKDNPARWHGYLDKILPSPGKISQKGHHKAMPINSLSAFFRDLRDKDSISSKALQFLILTATRSNEVRGATWDEIDFEKETWTIPATRMKAAKEHRVPLSPAALELLKSLPRFAGEKIVFVAPQGGQLSDMALTVLMRKMNADAVPHGFRSTFRDWVAEHTCYPNHVAEMALAHTISNKVEAAYRRGDLFDKRREMMNDWGCFCSKYRQ